MATRQDPYAALRVTPDADDEVIKAAYKALMMKYHPDRNPNGPEADAEAKKINEAYAVLSEPSKRRSYDADQDDHRFERTSEARSPGGATQQDLWRFTDEVRAAYRDDRSQKKRSAPSSVLRNFGLRAFGGLSLLACAALVAFVFFHNGLQTGFGGLRGAKPFSFGVMTQVKALSPENLLAGVENAIAGGASQGEAAGGPKVIRIKPSSSAEQTVRIFRGGEGVSSIAVGGDEPALRKPDPLASLTTWLHKTFSGFGKPAKSRATRADN